MSRSAGVLLTLWLLTFGISSQFLMITPLLPEIGRTYGVPPERLGIVVGAYALAVAVISLVAGPVSDRLGRRAILRFGTAAMAVALLAHQLVGSFEGLVGLRLVTGIAGGLASAWAAYVGDVFPYERRGAAMGIAMSGMAFGQIAGVPLGTVLAGRVGFQAPFVAFGVAMALVAVLSWLTLPEPEGEVRSTGGVADAFRGYVEVGRRLDVGAMCVASVLMMGSVSVLVVYLPTWLHDRFNASNNEVALSFAIGGVANAFAGPGAGWLSDRIGRKRIVVGSGLALSATMLVLAGAPTLALAYAAFFFVMISAGMRMSPLQTLVSALVPGSRRGSVLALSLATGQAGFALGSAVAGPIYQAWGFTGNAVVAAIGGVVTAGVVAWGLPEPASP